uniref:Reverse transcriptase domain-containing protein n=1 Tax=Micrurus surinamensis TaxID=129470 RepID=A0A2D4PI68_MICSU
MALHYTLQHLESPNTYARVIFVDFSSAFNTIIPDILLNKLNQLAVPEHTYKWIVSFLTDRKQQVKLGVITSDTCTISTSLPQQGCVLSQLLFSLYTNDCISNDPSVKILVCL